MYFFPSLEPVCCSVSSSSWCFLTCIQVSQEAGKVVWYYHLFRNFPVCCDPHIQRLWCKSRSRCFLLLCVKLASYRKVVLEEHLKFLPFPMGRVKSDLHGRVYLAQCSNKLATVTIYTTWKVETMIILSLISALQIPQCLSWTVCLTTLSPFLICWMELIVITIFYGCW